MGFAPLASLIPLRIFGSAGGQPHVVQPLAQRHHIGLFSPSFASHWHLCIFPKKGMTKSHYEISMNFNSSKYKMVESDQFNFFVSSIKHSMKIKLQITNFCIRGHSITTWTRRGGLGVSGKSMVGHVTKGS
jgi:hypothetical protein